MRRASISADRRPKLVTSAAEESCDQQSNGSRGPERREGMVANSVANLLFSERVAAAQVCKELLAGFDQVLKAGFRVFACVMGPGPNVFRCVGAWVRLVVRKGWDFVALFSELATSSAAVTALCAAMVLLGDVRKACSFSRNVAR